MYTYICIHVYVCILFNPCLMHCLSDCDFSDPTNPRLCKKKSVPWLEKPLTARHLEVLSDLVPWRYSCIIAVWSSLGQLQSCLVVLQKDMYVQQRHYVFLFHLNFASKMHSNMHSSSENTLEQGKETFKVSSPSTSQLLFMSMSVPHMHTKMARWFT